MEMGRPLVEPEADQPSRFLGNTPEVANVLIDTKERDRKDFCRRSPDEVLPDPANVLVGLEEHDTMIGV